RLSAAGPLRPPVSPERDLLQNPARTVSLAPLYDYEHHWRSPLSVRPNQRSLPVRLWRQDHGLLGMVFQAERRPTLSGQQDFLYERGTDHHPWNDERVHENRDRSGLVGERLLRTECALVQQ